MFFVAWVDDSFVLLHQFMKKSQKTPLREIEKAKREFADLTERGLSNE
nr:type II toxin-antitoxin system RelE/ParE family toxin [Ruminococcus bromii]